MGALDRLAEEWRRASDAPALSIAVLRRGALLHAGHYGNARPQTVYQTGSLGKQFTAALALLLAARGDGLGLDAVVAPHLPELPPSWSGITLRHLLSHTSGMPDAGYDSLDLARDYTDSEIVAAIASTAALEFPPGGAWNYSNAGYVLAGIAIGRSTGAFYGDLLRDLIFIPTEMTTALVNSPAAPVGHTREGGSVVAASYVSPTLNRLADGGISLTLADLVRWEGALAGPWGARVAEMFVETRLTTGAPSAYGLGWFLNVTDRGRVAEHDGMWQGFSAAMVRHLDDGLTAIALADIDDFPAAQFARALIAAAQP
jgi:CubicO group peptidase (beta-lactamase class C family)